MLKKLLRKLRNKNSNPLLKELENHLLSQVMTVNDINSVKYQEALLLNSLPRPIKDYTFHCDESKTISALFAASKLNRLDILRKVVGVIGQNSASDQDFIEKCLSFTQKYFFWHFAGQPIFNKNIIEDPIANLLLRSARCGTSARFLVDLLLVAGFKAGIFCGAAHTTAAIFQDKCWRLLDTALYPPGVFPKGSDGGFLSVNEALSNHNYLDKPPSYINFNKDYIDLFLSLYPEAMSLPFNTMTFQELLKRPIFPSAGYFGNTFFSQSGRRPIVQIFQKKGLQSSNNSYTNFGWERLKEVENYRAPNVEVFFLPSHISKPRIEASDVVWDAPEFYDKDRGLIYNIYISTKPNKWSYADFKVGCTFDCSYVHKLSTKTNRIPLSEIKIYGNFISIAPSYANTPAENFVLQTEQLKI